ncbi:MAG: cyclase family protein [Candidatus Obscuribacterales bacterium]|nr:cyclase family protein [Candidatus Obscuribacterales bacterium]
MSKLVDLTRPLEVLDKNSFPEILRPLFRIISPEVEFVDHAAGARIMGELFRCGAEELPAGEGWAEENLSISSHLGTHVDAPWHYGSTCGGKPARTIDQIELSELYCDAVVLDLSHKKGTGAAITVDDLRAALDRVEYRIKEGDAVLVRTDHDKFALTDPVRYNYPGLVGESATWLADQGATIGGTDATGWDRPFHVMIGEYMQTKNKEKIWDAHYAHREKDFFVVQQLANLDQLPAHGFKVGFFPLRLMGASAAPARVVAFLN